MGRGHRRGRGRRRAAPAAGSARGDAVAVLDSRSVAHDHSRGENRPPAGGVLRQGAYGGCCREDNLWTRTRGYRRRGVSATVTACARAYLMERVAKQAEVDAAIRSIQALSAAAAHLCRRLRPPLRASRRRSDKLRQMQQRGAPVASSVATAEDKAAYAALVCVRRWGEILAIRQEAERAVAAAEARLTAEREELKARVKHIGALWAKKRKAEAEEEARAGRFEGGGGGHQQQQP